MNPYEILGVDPTSSIVEIKRAYRVAARQHHPDRATDDLGAGDRMRAINQAWEVLQDPVRRATLDAALGFDGAWERAETRAERVRRERRNRLQRERRARQRAAREAEIRAQEAQARARAGRHGPTFDDPRWPSIEPGDLAVRANRQTVVNDDVRASVHVAEGGGLVINGDVGGHVAIRRDGRAVINGDVGGAIHLAEGSAVVVNGDVSGAVHVAESGGCSITIVGDFNSWG